MHATTSKLVATVVFTLQSKVFTRPENTSLETENEDADPGGLAANARLLAVDRTCITFHPRENCRLEGASESKAGPDKT